LQKEDLIETVLKLAKFVKVNQKVKAIKEHPADDKILECAVAAKADFIVSGDKHLLDVRIYKKIQIQTAKEFLDRLNT
jgi:uncharacterized protein